MVIELLTLTVKDEDCAEFLRKNADLWKPALQATPGFEKYEIWRDRANSGAMYIVIHWHSMEQWKAFPPELLQQLNAGMGECFAISTGHALDIVQTG